MSTTESRSFTRNLPSFRALRHRNFRFFWGGTLSLAAGQGMLQFTIAWLALDLTDSVSQLGSIIFITGIPRIFFMLLGGVLADRVDRMKIVRISQLTLMAYAVIVGLLVWFDLIKVWHLYVGSLVVGCVQAFNSSSLVSMIRDLVSKDDIMSAVVINSMLMNTVSLLGPTLAGALIPVVGIATALFIVAGCFGMGMLVMLFIKLAARSAPVQRTSIRQDLSGGIKFVMASPFARALVITGFAWGLFGQAIIQLMPGFGRKELDLNSAHTGLLLLAVAAGSLTGNLILSSLTYFQKKHWILMFGTILFPVALIGLSAAPSLAVAMALLPFVGMGSVFYVSVGSTLLQTTVPQNYLGRVTSIWYLGGGMMFVGALPIGLLGDAIGLRYAFAAASGLFLLVSMWYVVVNPAFRNWKVES